MPDTPADAAVPAETEETQYVEILPAYWVTRDEAAQLLDWMHDPRGTPWWAVLEAYARDNALGVMNNQNITERQMWQQQGAYRVVSLLDHYHRKLLKENLMSPVPKSQVQGGVYSRPK